jgi:hypothetical protein
LVHARKIGFREEGGRRIEEGGLRKEDWGEVLGLRFWG